MAALPAMWLVNQDRQREGVTAPNVAAVGLDAADAVAATTTAPGPAAADPMAPAGTVAPMFLARPDDETKRRRRPPRPPVPEAPGPSVAREATFRRSVGSAGSCLVNGVPADQIVTVSNLANGRSVECWTGPLPSGSEEQIVLHPERFADLADLTDAPVHVDVEW